MNERKHWIGVDLDGTLAVSINMEDRLDGKIGDPIPSMVERVKKWLSEGEDVRIFTARASHFHDASSLLKVQHRIPKIIEWCKEHIGQELPITCYKDSYVKEIWDDRAIGVVKNTGEIKSSQCPHCGRGEKK